MEEPEALLKLQNLVVQALRLADAHGLDDVGISLDAARIQIGARLQEVGRARDIINVKAPIDLP